MSHRRPTIALRSLTTSLCAALCAAGLAGAGLAWAGEPATPFGKWMKPNMGAPLAGQDFDTLKKSFELVAAKPPKGDYPKWSSIARKGADASAKQELSAVKAACKECHDAYKEKYKKERPEHAYQ